MKSDISKTVIRIISDFCLGYSASVLANEFVLSVTPKIIKQIPSDNFDLAQFIKIMELREDFFIANDLDLLTFSKLLFHSLNRELLFYDSPTFYDSIILFKQKVENGHARGFPKEKTSEDALRSVLAIYLQEETFCESRSGSGNNDIVVPSEKVIIEVKLWDGKEYYLSGFPELNEYLVRSTYEEGYYVIFDYNIKPNLIIKEKGEEFDIKYESSLIHVVFIRMNTPRPSKIYSESKKKS